MSDENVTPRGFSYITFKDANDVECSLQQSSAIDFQTEGALDHPGSSMIWLGCDNANPKVIVQGQGWQPVPMPEGYIANTRMHLTRAHAQQLIKHLQVWLDTGSFDPLNAEEIDD